MSVAEDAFYGFSAAVCLALIALLILYNAPKWSVDDTGSVLNMGAYSPKQQLSSNVAFFELWGKGVIVPEDKKNDFLVQAHANPLIQQQFNSSDTYTILPMDGYNAVVTNYTGAQLSYAAGSSQAQGALLNQNVSGISSVVPPSDLGVHVDYAGNDTSMPLLVGQGLSKEDVDRLATQKDFINSSTASRAVPETLMVYKDSVSGENVLLAPGFSPEQLSSLSSSPAVASALARSQIPSGQALPIQQTPGFNGVSGKSLASNPGLPVSVPFDPLGSLGLGSSWWMMPLLASLFFAVIYYLSKRISQEPSSVLRKRPARSSTELSASEKAGFSSRRRRVDLDAVIELEPLFRVRVIDNTLDSDKRVRLEVVNSSTRPAQEVFAGSGSYEISLGDLSPGQSRAFVLKVQINPSGKADAYIRLSPVVVEGRVQRLFEFSFPVEEL